MRRASKLRGTIQNDILKEYIARGHLHLPAAPVDAADHRHLRLLRRATCPAGTRSPSPATTSARPARPPCRRSPSRWPTASPTSRRRSTAGLDVDEFAPRLSFFFNAHNNLFEEVAKYRAARRMWARIMTRALRRQRRALQAAALPHPDRRVDADRPAAREQHRARRPCRRFAAVLRRHPDPAHQRLRRGARRCRPTRAAKIALRTQQIIGYESGVADTVDPLAGSYFVEALTDEVEQSSLGVPGADRRARRCRGSHRGRVHAGRDRARGLRATPRPSTTARRWSSG